MKRCVINPKCKHCDVVYAGELPIMLICHKRNVAEVKVKDCEECYKTNGGFGLKEDNGND